MCRCSDEKNPHPSPLPGGEREQEQEVAVLAMSLVPGRASVDRETRVVRWLWVRWHGVPMPVRWFIFVRQWPELRADAWRPSDFDGCGCLVRVKRWWAKLKALVLRTLSPALSLAGRGSRRRPGPLAKTLAGRGSRRRPPPAATRPPPPPGAGEEKEGAGSYAASARGR